MKFFKWKSPAPVQPQPIQDKGVSYQRPAVFMHLGEHDLSQIYHAASIKHFQSNDFIIKEGEECKYLYIILDGNVKLTDRNNIYNSYLHDGDFFGEIKFREKFLNIYSAIATKHSVVMEINHNIVSHLPEKVQLIIYQQLNHLSLNDIYRISSNIDEINKKNIELTSYIHNMRSQTDIFITSDVFQNIIKNIPKLPRCAGNLSSQLMDDSVSVKEVTEAVQREPALAAALLKAVNSAYYGLQEKVASLHHAILYLGFNNVYQIIVENSIKNILPQNEEYETIRLHSYIISLIASEVSAYCKKSKPLVNSTIGILHDLGKIVTLLLKKRYPSIKEMIDMADDSKIGSCLLRAWEFPENIINIIEHQYDPEFSHPEIINEEYRYEIAILYVAHVFYDMLTGESTMSTIFIDDYMATLGMQQIDCKEFYQQRIVPALLKNRQRLPDKINGLLQSQMLATASVRARAS